MAIARSGAWPARPVMPRLQDSATPQTTTIRRLTCFVTMAVYSFENDDRVDPLPDRGWSGTKYRANLVRIELAGSAFAVKRLLWPRRRVTLVLHLYGNSGVRRRRRSLPVRPVL